MGIMAMSTRDRMVRAYRAMRAARRLDDTEADLSRRGEAYFHLGGSGHEAIAALAGHLTPDDWLHPHYRDKALLLARGLTIEDYLHALLATERAPSRGRDMPPFHSDAERHLLSMPTLVGNNALQADGVAAEVRGRPGRPVVICGFGDGGSQQGEVLEAIAEAARARLPVLFLVEDNGLALSTPTAGRTFYDLPDGPADRFWGVPITRIDGRDVLATDAGFGRIIAAMRRDRLPHIAIFRCERLVSHSNSDDQTVYRSAGELDHARAGDPLPRLRAWLLEQGVPEAELAKIEADIEAELRDAITAARAAGRDTAFAETRRPLPPETTLMTREYRGAPEAGPRAWTMLEAMRETLRARLRADARVSLHGQDIEDPKGDVFGVTRGLSSEFPGRVRNAPLAEATITGMAIGRALAGGRPVGFLQFADFFPVAFNQIYAELGTIYWRSGGRWEAPVILMAVTGGYRPGLGPCHAQSPEAILAHTPGIDVFMPSNAGDAAGLLNAAFESGRPSVFLYPKNLLNERALSTSPDVEHHFVPIGRARIARAGGDITLVGWGNTVALCEQAADALARAGVEAEVLDLRTLAPWDCDAVLASAARTGRVIVTHEDMHTCGLGAEIVATLAERAGRPVNVARVTTPDTFLPYRYENQLDTLPSLRGLLTRAADMLDLELRWEAPPAEAPGRRTVRAIGSSPSDENVRIVQWHVRAGDTVHAGDALASVEADKAAFQIAAPEDGRVLELAVPPGEAVRVGTPIAQLEVAVRENAAAATVQYQPVLRRKRRRPRADAPAAAAATGPVPVVLSSINACLGSREMDNAALLGGLPDWKAADVVQRTGIERRYWVGPQEDVLSLAVRACRELLEQERLTISDIDAIVCSTGTPRMMTPSLACQVLRALSPAKGDVMVQAWDVNAACTGFLYALQAAWDTLQARPAAKVIVLTAETLSPLLDPTDPGTVFLFGDAATATLVAAEPGAGGANPVRVRRPVCSARGEAPHVLSVPLFGSGECVRMEGQQVFRTAVRKMIEMLESACEAAGLEVGDLAMVVPHQANERIIEAIRQKIGVPPEHMFNHIRRFGNTSSNTLPIALRELLPAQRPGAHIGLVAFGGGFTFGAAILDRV
jgi:2-oxoisovalerate dehydrogenase E1 component